MLICQIFATCISASIELPNEQHPFGTHIEHLHSDHHKELVDSDNSAVDNEEKNEHEHENHSHLSCYPPVDNSIAPDIAIAGVIENSASNYLNYHYAPPIPPPSV
jgi:hypothetical protein